MYICIYMYIYILHTHTHTHTYIYIYYVLYMFSLSIQTGPVHFNDKLSLLFLGKETYSSVFYLITSLHTVQSYVSSLICLVLMA